MRCTSFYRCYPVACYPTAFDFLQFPLTSEAEDRDSIAERRCVNAATPIPPTNHNSIITLISALSAMGLPNQSFYSTHFGTMITVNVFSFRFDPFSIDKEINTDSLLTILLNRLFLDHYNKWKRWILIYLNLYRAFRRS